MFIQEALLPLVLRPVCLKELSKSYHDQNFMNSYIKSEFEGTWESALINDFSVPKVWEPVPLTITHT